MKSARGRGAVPLLAALILLAHGAAYAQAPRPAAPPFKAGLLPRSWPASGPRCGNAPEFLVHKYNEDLFILRQSGCSHFEKPFLYLIFGRDKVLLLDTGAGSANVGRVVKGVIDGWASARGARAVRLVVAHTHAHSDHTAGDEQLKILPGALYVAPDLEAVRSFFGIRRWPEEVVQYDLGGRVVDVIPIPGHEATSIAVYDRQTALLFTGDTLYPGRLYVEEPAAYVQSIRRLIAFTRDKPVAHILGAHIENTRTPYLDYGGRAIHQPDEHALELGRAHLLELQDALEQMRGAVSRRVMRDFTVWPLNGRR